MTAAASDTLGLVYTLAAIFGILVTALSTLAGHYWKHEKAKAEKVDAIEATRSAEMRALTVALLGEEPTFEQPDPEPGIIRRLDVLEQAVSDVQKQVTPNGGNTQRLGDRIVRIERQLGMTD